jgi:hypothetical protein
MVLAFTVTRPSSKSFSPSEVLYHVTKAAPPGPRSDYHRNPLISNFLPI